MSLPPSAPLASPLTPFGRIARVTVFLLVPFLFPVHAILSLPPPPPPPHSTRPSAPRPALGGARNLSLRWFPALI